MNYDFSIHRNPDARAWAKFFIETVESNPEYKIDEEIMIVWFANAMMAMHDHIVDNDKTDAIVIASLKEAYRYNADPLPDEGGEKWVDVEFLAAIDHVLEYYHTYEQKKLWIAEKESFNNVKE